MNDLQKLHIARAFGQPRGDAAARPAYDKGGSAAAASMNCRRCATGFASPAPGFRQLRNPRPEAPVVRGVVAALER